MKASGFTLLELIIVLAVMGILSSIAVINFSSWQQKSQIEKQTRELFATLNQARIDAMQHKQPRGVVLNANGYGYTFTSYSSENQLPAAGVGIQTRAVSHRIAETDGPSDNITIFDVRGYTSTTGTFQTTPSNSSALVDCIVVGPGQTKMGKNNNGACTIQ